MVPEPDFDVRVKQTKSTGNTTDEAAVAAGGTDM